MVAPVSARHFQTRSRNRSRPSSCRVVPSARSCFSITECTAIAAWSVPQIHSVRRPRHPLMPHQRVLDRAVERVPHVQLAGDVRRRQGDHERVALGRAGRRRSRPVASSHSANRRGSTVAGSNRVRCLSSSWVAITRILLTGVRLAGATRLAQPRCGCCGHRDHPPQASRRPALQHARGLVVAGGSLRVLPDRAGRHRDAALSPVGGAWRWSRCRCARRSRCPG